MALYGMAVGLFAICLEEPSNQGRQAGNCNHEFLCGFHDSHPIRRGAYLSLHAVFLHYGHVSIGYAVLKGLYT